MPTKIESPDEKKFQDEGYKGVPLPIEFGSRGPKDDERCTDVVCLSLFLAYIAGMVLIVILMRSSSNIEAMRDVMDSEGNRCGKDQGYEQFPKLLFFKFTPNFRSVCVQACPKFDYNQIRFNSTGTATEYIQPVYFSNFSAAVKAKREEEESGNQRRRRMLRIDIEAQELAQEGEPDQEQDNSIFEYDEEAAQDYYTEQQWNDYVSNFNLVCRTNDDVSTCENNPGQGVYMYDSRDFVGNVCTPVAPRIVAKLGGFGDLSSAFEDLKTSMWFIVGSVVVTILVSMVVLCVTKVFIGCLIWCLICLAILITFLISAFCFAIVYYAEKAAFVGDYANRAGPEVAAQYQKIMEIKQTILYVGIGTLILGIVMLIIIIVKRKAISVAAGVIEVAADYIFDHPTLFVIALAFFVLQVGTFIACLYGLLVIHTNGEKRADNNGSPFPIFEYSVVKWFAMIYFVIGTYWVTVFWNNVTDFAVASSAVDDYFKKDVGTFKEAFKAMTFHAGTVAYGSLVLFPMAVFKTLFGWIHALARDDKPNAIQKFLGKACCVCCWPYEKFCLRLDDNAFAMVALTQLNFCPGGKKEFYLSRRIGKKIGDAKIIGFVYNLAGRIGIAGITTWISYLVFSRAQYFKERVSNPAVPTLAVFFASVVVSQLVMNMFGTASSAILMCYLVQLDTGNKPNYSELDETVKNFSAN